MSENPTRPVQRTKTARDAQSDKKVRQGHDRIVKTNQNKYLYFTVTWLPYGCFEKT